MSSFCKNYVEGTKDNICVHVGGEHCEGIACCRDCDCLSGCEAACGLSVREYMNKRFADRNEINMTKEAIENHEEMKGDTGKDGVPRVIAAEVAEQESEKEREKALAPYSDNLPYDRTRIIEETKFLIKHEIAAKYEIGKRLIVLKENENLQTFANILDEQFGGLSQRHAYNYMLFSRKISQLPNLKNFAEGGGNWTKCLALLESCNEEELKALEAGEPIAGKTLDELDKMSFRGLKDALKKARKHNDKLSKQLEKYKEGFDGEFLTKKKNQMAVIAHAKTKFWSAYVEIKNLKLSEIDDEILREVMHFYEKVSQDAQAQHRQLLRQPEIKELLGEN